MSRPLRIPHPQTALHLYRHLLREASYVPPIARSFIDGQIKDRFRRHRQEGEEKGRRHILQAHHELRFLRAANAGDMARMRRLLLRAFGRVGRRRRELMAHLVERESPSNTEELERYKARVAAIASEGRKLDWLDTWHMDKFTAFARSQAQTSFNNSPKATLTINQMTPSNVIPVENIWGRPFAPKPARTKLKKMWKAVADKCLPPLPREEWELLGALATGKIRDRRWLPPPRRPVARGAFTDAHNVLGWNWKWYATRPVSLVDRPANRRNKLLSGAVDENTPTGDPEPINCHRYTPRFWRRLFLDVWRLTATMEKTVDGQGWDVAWGKPGFKAAPATSRDMEFFEEFAKTKSTPAAGAGPDKHAG